jgi:hypothetical protein
MKFDKWIVTEASYPGNLGIEEMIRFYKIASKAEIKEMEMLVKKRNWDDFRALIKKVLGVDLL